MTSGVKSVTILSVEHKRNFYLYIYFAYHATQLVRKKKTDKNTESNGVKYKAAVITPENTNSIPIYRKNKNNRRLCNKHDKRN